MSMKVHHPTASIVDSHPPLSTIEHAPLLRKVLYANAIFSTFCALLMILASRPITNFLGWSQPWMLTVIGVVLLPFAFFVVSCARRLPQSRQWAWVILEMDLLWVIGSAVILFLQWPAATTVGGRWAIAIIAEIVALFAILEYVGLRRMKSA